MKNDNRIIEFKKYRDLKPDNFFFKEKNGQKILKIGDFGITKTYRPQKKSLSSSETHKHYQSPEISEGGRISYKTDIWSLYDKIQRK